MLLWCVAAGVLSWLQLAGALSLVGSGIGVAEPAKVWSILGFLVRGEGRSILADLYPFVTDLEEFQDEAEEGGFDLATKVAGMLSREYGMDDIAALLPIYSNLYPMGILSDDFDSSNENYFVLNGKRYQKPEDVFYLKSKELKRQAEVADSEVVRDDEVIIGANKKAPVIILHGCPDDGGDFEEFNRNLYSEAILSDKLRYVWRSTCSLGTSSVAGVPVSFTLRNESSPAALPVETLNVPAEFTKKVPSLNSLEAEKLSGIDLKVTKLVADHYSDHKNFTSTLEYLTGIINSLPLVLEQLATLDVDTSDILKSNEKLKASGVDYNMLGLYTNGQNMRLSDVDNHNVINAVVLEYFRICSLGTVLQSIDNNATSLTAKQLLEAFSKVSLPNLEELQPVKVDLHRIPGFSESVIYFNDIEIDSQYEELDTDVQSFFESSRFGELPEYRHNWNEIIFVIDFGRLDMEETKVALEGLNRAVGVIAQGYPQRVGLLPLNTGSADGIINTIYRLKDRNLNELMEFLEDIPTSDYISKRYRDTPDYSRVLEELEIHDTSIVINGEVYPFKKNSWHYLIARVIKKDKAYLQKELSKFTKSQVKDIDVRGLLHLKSSNTRSGKYTPDYFVDSSYTSLNNSALQAVDDRVFEYTKGKEYLTLHTVTLVDDFGSSQALRRLKNLLNTSFVGVRIRMINTGSLTEDGWTKLKSILSDGINVDDFDSLIKNTRNSHSPSQLRDEVLAKWLTDLTQESFSSGSFLVLNGRFVKLDEDEIFTTKQAESLIKREATRTLDVLQALDIVCPSTLEERIDPDHIEMISSILTKLFYHGAQLYNNGIDYTPESFLPRISINLEGNNHTVFQSSDVEKLVDVSFLIDPTEERSQKLTSLMNLLKAIPFVNLRVAMLPTKDLKIMPIDRIYLGGNEDFIIEQKSKGQFQVELDPPSNFYVTNTTQLGGVVVEVHAFRKGQLISESIIDGIGGVCLELVDSQDKVVGSCITMKTFGYGQLIAKSLGANFSVRSCDPKFNVTLFASSGRSDNVKSTNLSLLNFNKYKLHVEVEEIPNIQLEKLDNERMHVFTILKDNGEDEEKTENMIISLLLNVPEDTEIKFWILDQPFLSKSFKEFCRKINQSADLRGSVELIEYNWPLWLRPQRFSDRRMDLFKVLFIDVMFPQNVSRVLYMNPDASPINPVEIYNQDVTVPFSLFEASGPGYWDSGYWEKTLKERRAKFHTTEPAFLINLQELRKLGMGDKLRIHYQRLSADRNSLINAAQDLLNDLQVEVPINTLKPLKYPRLEVNSEEVAQWRIGRISEEELYEEEAADELMNDLVHDEL